jgi:hypothetical protein
VRCLGENEKHDFGTCSQMREIVLYTTEHCSLCDAAMDLLLSIPEIRGCTLRTLDIATSDQLMVEFGQRSPVVAIGDAQLDAPFDAEKLREWLQKNAVR